MPMDDYDVIQPDLNTDVGRDWLNLTRARPSRAGRLLDVIEDALRDGLAFSYRVLSANPPVVEVFMVPPRYALLAVPDAAALLRVDHAARRIAIIDVMDDYGGPNEATQWLRVQTVAANAI